MKSSALFTLLLALLLSSAASVAKESGCLNCHDFGPDSPVHNMLEGPHRRVMNNCERCHGPSEEHMARPTVTAPGVSFGPRWSSSVAEHDNSCLKCHKRNAAKHWQDALHMVNNLTCVTCHELHVNKDPILQDGGQQQICSNCHQTQRSGMHAIESKLEDNPDCTSCHNPHADQRPDAVMLSNDSTGCRTCHDLDAMANDSTVRRQANSYHRAMDNQELICSNCHGGVAHGPTDAAEPFTPLPRANGDITLFFPGQSDADWILSEHPGSQPLRQGSNCQRCHRGSEKEMGQSLGGNSRKVSVAFRESSTHLSIQLSWAGSATDSSVSFMWNNDSVEAFTRGGCWSACHSDMPGMSRDRGQKLDKYLKLSRTQQQQIGQNAINKPESELNTLLAEGTFVEMWKIDLNQGELSTAQLLSNVKWHQAAQIPSATEFADGNWQVTMKYPLQAGAKHKGILPGGTYTFGIALQGKQHKGARHWVSLPMTFSLDGDDTDFIAE